MLNVWKGIEMKDHNSFIVGKKYVIDGSAPLVCLGHRVDGRAVLESTETGGIITVSNLKSWREVKEPRVIYLKFTSDGNHIDLFREGPKDEFIKFVEVLP